MCIYIHPIGNILGASPRCKSTTLVLQVLNWSLPSLSLVRNVGDPEKIWLKKTDLVGGFSPLEKYSQNGNLPQVGVNIKNISNHHLEIMTWKKLEIFTFKLCET